MLLMVNACSISPVIYLIKTQVDLTVALLSQLSFYHAVLMTDLILPILVSWIVYQHIVSLTDGYLGRLPGAIK